MAKYKDRAKADATTRNLISKATLKSVGRDVMVEAELGRLGARLGADPNLWHDEDLVRRRAALLRKLPKWKGLDQLIEPTHSVATHVKDLLLPWKTLNLPFMYEGINETPGSAGGDGEIGTAGLYAGGIGWIARLDPFDGATLHHERWWIHNWRNSVVFPAAPYRARLEYRFTVDSDCTVYRDDVFTGSLQEFVTIGSTPNVASSPVDSWTNWTTVGWPVNVGLPTPDVALGGAVPVSGSIGVAQGASAALGFIYGTIISAASGEVIAWGNFGTRKTVPATTPVDYRLYDQIEYRFEPDWLRQAVLDALALP